MIAIGRRMISVIERWSPDIVAAQLEQIVAGPFMNSSALRVDLTGTNFADLLAQVRQDHDLMPIDNWEVPFESRSRC